MALGRDSAFGYLDPKSGDDVHPTSQASKARLRERLVPGCPTAQSIKGLRASKGFELLRAVSF